MDDFNLKKPRIHCEQEFLKEFCERRRTIGHTISSTDTLKKWDALFLSIRASDLSLNFEKEELLNMLNEDLNYYNQSTIDSPLFQILKRLIDTGKLTSTDSPLSHEVGFGNLTDQDLTTIYLVTDGDDSKTTTGDSLGVCVIPIETCFDNHAMISVTKTLAKGEEINWAAILNNNIPKLNSLIIMDRYIVRPPKQRPGFDCDNLFQILDALIPDSLMVSFHLTLMTIIPKGENISELYDKINYHLLKTKRNTPVELWIHPTIEEHFHNRAILSNNLFISNGSGFKLRGYSGKTINEADIIISPVGLCGNVGEKQNWTNYFNIASSIIADKDVQKYPKNNNSRLFV